MILNRLGNKTKIAKKIQEYFPQHNAYIEPFFGAGGMFFNKPLAKYNIVNDIDSDIFNLYMVVKNKKEQLYKEIELMPVHNDLFQYWRENKETNDVMQAVRFLFLSNFGYMGKPETLRMSINNTKEILLNNIISTFAKIKNVTFHNTDGVNFIKSISIRNKKETFIYCDPPYINTSNNYSNSFTKEQSISLLDALIEIECKFAISEFNNEFVINEAKERGLNIINIGTRQSIRNRSVEILITNYVSYPKLFKDY